MSEPIYKSYVLDISYCGEILKGTLKREHRSIWRTSINPSGLYISSTRWYLVFTSAFQNHSINVLIIKSFQVFSKLASVLKANSPPPSSWSYLGLQTLAIEANVDGTLAAGDQRGTWKRLKAETCRSWRLSHQEWKVAVILVLTRESFFLLCFKLIYLYCTSWKGIAMLMMIIKKIHDV